MTPQEFNNLSEEQKNIAIFEAKKITERFDERMKYELFQIDQFFVETTTSLQRQFKRVTAAFSLKEVPFIYLKENATLHAVFPVETIV